MHMYIHTHTYMHVYIVYTHIYIANTWTWWCFETFSNIQIYQNIWFRYTHIYVYMHTRVHIHVHMHKLIMFWLNQTTLGEESQHMKHLCSSVKTPKLRASAVLFSEIRKTALKIRFWWWQLKILKNVFQKPNWCSLAWGLWGSSNAQSALYECVRVHGYVYKAKTYWAKDYSMYTNVCICIHICMYT